MDNDRRPSLTSTSYIVLGLLELYGQGTPYDLKGWAAASIGNFWSVPHSALYAEPERLAAAGYLVEHRETFGRRRKLYSVTESGREALDAWRQAPTDGLPELRDPGLLKLFFGADVGPLAKSRHDAHQPQARRVRGTRRCVRRPGRSGRPVAPAGAGLTLEAGLGHEREWVRFWSRLASEPE